MRLFRRLYDWVLSWAGSPYALPALFVLAFAEASFFPVPPDVLLIALALSAPLLAYRYALLATLGSVIGGLCGYVIGWGGWKVLEAYFYHYVPGVTAEGFALVEKLFDQYGFWTIFIAGFTPIPYKIFTISAGVFHLNIAVFVLASVIGRGLRFFLVATLLYYCGTAAKKLIDRYFNLFSLLLVVVLVIILLVLKGLSAFG